MQTGDYNVKKKWNATTMITLIIASMLTTMIFGVSPANAAITAGKFGNALEFDGANDYVTVPDSPSLRLPSTELTVEAWIYFSSSSPGLQLMIRKWLDADGGSLSYVLGRSEDNKIYGAVEDQELAHFPSWTTAQTISDLGIEATWAHIAFTWKKGTIAASDGHIFVNGASGATTFEPVGYSEAFSIGYAAYPLYFARKADVVSFSSNYFKGGLDEVRVSNIARTSFSLATPPSFDGSTVALWHFDEGSGLTTNDASANANHGTISGATWTGTPTVVTTDELPISFIAIALVIAIVLVIAVLLVYFKKRKR